MHLAFSIAVERVHSAAMDSSSMEERLRARFGLDAFRPWQKEAIDALLFGEKRVLVVAPTGGGKSLCYQFPATELSGTSFVISPLIALMEDQVQSLTARGISATYLASNLDADERRKRERGMREGNYQLVYVAPERLAQSGYVESLAQLKPKFVAIDEAHCISQWGHDFRPDYLRLGEVLKALAPEHVLACTATATPAVRSEILQKLDLAESETAVILRGFARPNLHLAAEQVDGSKERLTRIKETLREALGSPTRPVGAAIVYVGTRKLAEELATVIGKEGYSTASYHAGLDGEKRADVSRRFAIRKVNVVVATNAFGMGIDRSDVRAVIHANAPSSIEGYYQEVGRAGRDGQPAHGLLLTQFSDFGLRRRLLERGRDEGHEVDRAHVDHQWRMFLDLMRYVDAGSCRHDFVLRYFGDERELLGGCGHCDVCEKLESQTSDNTLSDEDSLLVARKALAGVARNRGRAGLHAVADMLSGNESARLRELGLHELSTFGILKNYSKPWVLSLLRRLLAAGLVDLTAGEFPVPLLTKGGHEVMTGEKPLRLLMPRDEVKKRREKGEKKAKGASAPLPAGLDKGLFDKLRETRMQLAKSQSVPAYVIAHDRTLQEITMLKPRSRTELGMAHGMGPARLDAYGDAFLEAIRTHA